MRRGEGEMGERGKGRKRETGQKNRKGAFGNQRNGTNVQIHKEFQYRSLNETQRRGRILIDFVLSLSLSTSVKSWRKFAGSG